MSLVKSAVFNKQHYKDEIDKLVQGNRDYEREHGLPASKKLEATGIATGMGLGAALGAAAGAYSGGSTPWRVAKAVAGGGLGMFGGAVGSIALFPYSLSNRLKTPREHEYDRKLTNLVHAELDAPQ